MIVIIPEKWVILIRQALARIADILIRLHITPNMVSVISLLTALAAGLFFAFGHAFAAAGMIILSGIFDGLDGMIAAKTNKRSLFGAIFDSTLDRYGEFFIYLGLAYYFRERWPLWILFFAFLGSTMVSYTRARSEGLGIDCKIGFMQRAERLALLVIGALIGTAFKIYDQAMIVVLIAITLVSNITAFQRTFYVRKIENQKKKR